MAEHSTPATEPDQPDQAAQDGRSDDPRVQLDEPPARIPGPYTSAGSHGGRTSSWAAVAAILVGFLLGGIGLVSGPTWWLFWTGVGIVAVGAVFGMLAGIFSDVVLYARPQDAAAVTRAIASEKRLPQG